MGYARIAVAVALQRYIDFTPVALRAREVAMALAKTKGAEVDVVTVEAPVALLPGTETTGEKLNRFVQGFLDAGLRANGHLLAGKPSDQIVEFVGTLGADLLIIGSHSKRGLLDIGLGGTSSALVERAPCPVLMVWPTEAETAQVKQLMIPGLPFVFPYG